MADNIKQFNPGDKLTADDTNANNLLLKKWALDNSASEAYIDTKMAQLSSELGAQITSINTQISSLNTQISNVNTQFSKMAYTQKSKTVGIGTTQMTSYLPQDSGKYLVWAEAYRGATGTADDLMVYTDKQTTGRRVYQLDGDSGRSSRGLAYFIVPTTSTGYIKFSGVADYIYLCGYYKL